MPSLLLVVSFVTLLLMLATTTTSSSIRPQQANSLAQTPPMGWRSWNLFGPNVNQSLMEHIMDGMVHKKRSTTTSKNGKTTTASLLSLCDLGYCDVGLDDNWQACHSPHAAPGMNYHDAQGRPLVNLQRFPDLRNMTAHAHSLGLNAGWYHNNCICSDHCEANSSCETQIQADVQALIEYDFDSIKLDGCGGEMNLTLWNHYLQELSSRPILVENCHGGYDTPLDNGNNHNHNGYSGKDPCPFHFYRTSHDIRPSYKSIMFNLGTIQQFHQRNLSFPGCWAYPDMLQVGVVIQKDDGTTRGLSLAETRSHFGAWAIVSSPLVLSHDVNNEQVTDAIWDLIANREAIAINQEYAGDSGGPFYFSPTTVHLHETNDNANDPTPIPIPAHQFLAKRLGGGRVAVLFMNSSNKTDTLYVPLRDIPGIVCDRCVYHVRDVWNHANLGSVASDVTFSIAVEPHDAAFILLQPAELPVHQPQYKNYLYSNMPILRHCNLETVAASLIVALLLFTGVTLLSSKRL